MARLPAVLGRGPSSSSGANLKVAIVCPYAWDRPGGVQSHIRALAPTLRERGHDVLVLAPRSSAAPPTRDNGVELVGRSIPIPANGSVAPLSFGPLATARIRKAIGRFRPDVVHLHEPLIPSLSLLTLVTVGAPSVGTFHAASERSVGYRLARPLLRAAANRLDVRTAVSDPARDLVARYFPGEYILTPNGVDIKSFASADPLQILREGRKILFLGRLERRKGLEVLIQAVARLDRGTAALIVAGTGPEEKRCRSLARTLGVEITWLGRLSDDDVPRAYKACDVFCAPGLGGESFGIVLVEAMAAGTPVICSDLPGFRAVAGGAATLVPPGDAGRLADALRVVLGSEEETSRMAKMGSRMAGLFDWPRLAAGVEQTYERAVGA